MKFLKVLVCFAVVLSIMLSACSQTPVEQPAPSVEEAGAVTIKVQGPGNETQYELDQKLAAEFTAETGINVEVVRGPDSTTDRLNEYLVLLGNEVSEFDVYQIDVIWPGILADHMVNLNEALSEEAATHFPAIIENNTVDGHLVGMPWYTDAGMLYYRTDLLEKYGFDGPPETWDELEEMAQTIQEGERSAGNEEFWGFVWQGNNYEGLTCDALEWQASHGGGQIIEADGTINVNNPECIAAFERAAGWVDTISPPDITKYLEEDSREIWQAGNAAFMRNWPYAYALGNSDDSPIKDQFDVALLPDGGGGHAATLGGWQLAVSNYSDHQQAAIEFVKYMTSPEVQKQRSIEAAYAPTIPELYEDEEVVEANPYYSTLQDVFFGEAVARPSSVSGEAYSEVSYLYFNAIHDILSGDVTASEALLALETNLTALTQYEAQSP